MENVINNPAVNRLGFSHEKLQNGLDHITIGSSYSGYRLLYNGDTLLWARRVNPAEDYTFDRIEDLISEIEASVKAIESRFKTEKR